MNQMFAQEDDGTGAYASACTWYRVTEKLGGSLG